MTVSRGARIYGAVALGGALGSVARWLVQGLASAGLGHSFPWGTLIVNSVGSFLIGLYFEVTDSDGRLLVSPGRRQFVLAGLCGGFTTFSSFSLETVLLAHDRRWLVDCAYVGASVPAWLVSVWVGALIGKMINRPSWRET